MIKHIFFDLDNTIFDFRATENIALPEVLEFAGVTPTDEIISKYREINSKLWNDMTSGILPRDFIKIERFKKTFELFNIDFSPIEAEARYEELLTNHFAFVPNALEVIKELFDSGKNLYIMTNGFYRIQKKRYEISGLEKYMKGFFVSDDIGFDKPDKRFFEKCFEQIENIFLDECIMVGDTLLTDIKGAENAGIKSIFFNRKNITDYKGIHFDCEIKDLREILDIVQDFQ